MNTTGTSGSFFQEKVWKQIAVQTAKDSTARHTFFGKWNTDFRRLYQRVEGVSVGAGSGGVEALLFQKQIEQFHRRREAVSHQATRLSGKIARTCSGSRSIILLRTRASRLEAGLEEHTPLHCPCLYISLFHLVY